MENDLIAKLRKNCQKSQRVFYETHAQRMFLIAFRYVSSESDADIVVNQSFLKAFTNIHQFQESNNGKIDYWLRKIVINEALTHLQSRKRLAFTNESEIPELNSYELADKDLSAEDYLKLICDLPLGYRTIFNMHAIEGYSHKEIADKLNIEESTSRSQLAHARKLLKQRLNQL